MSLFRVTTKAKVTPRAPSQEVNVQYPVTWFRANEGSKPVLSLSLVATDLERARKLLRRGITDNAINLDVAKSFLYHYGQTIQSTLDDDWTSYGITIGLKGDQITPLSLIQAEPKSTPIDVGTTDIVSPDDDPWMAGYVLAIYRLIRATIGEYKSQIASRVSTQLKALNGKAQEISDIVDMYKGWSTDRGYNVLIAAFDMYFHRFPLHPLSNLRIGTTGSRFRDCAALISYGYLMNLLGLPKSTDVMDWVFLEQIGNDIDRMMTSDDDLLDQYSYFPYHVDLGLVTKSAFSASANTYFFEWVHMIGALMKSQRSLNARHINEGRSLDILANAACVAYAFSSNFEFGKVYTETGEPVVMPEDDTESVIGGLTGNTETDRIIKSRDPSQWCLLINSKDGELPEKVKRFVVKSAANITSPRENSMEEHLKVIASMLTIT